MSAAEGRRSVGVLGAVVALVLLLVGVLHLVWTVTTWPLDDREDYARLVVGVPVDQLPPPGLTALVAGLLVAAAYLVGAVAGVLPVVGPRWILVTGVWVVAGVLLLRGGGGLVADLSGADYAPEDFVRLDQILYSPLCLALGAGTLGVGAERVLTRRRRLPA